MATEKKDTNPPQPEETKSAAPAADNTTPEEKALADKLMQELKASNVDINALQNETNPASATANAAGKTSPAASPLPAPPSLPADKTESMSAVSSSTPAPSVKKRFGFKLPFSKRKNTEVTPSEPPASTEAQQLTNEALMQLIDERLDKINGNDFITIKLSKKGLLVIAGIILACLWLYPLAKQYVTRSFRIPTININSIKLPLFNKSAAPITNTQTLQQAAPSPSPIRIRVRMGSDSLEQAAIIKSALEALGNVTVDIVKDPQVNAKQVLVVTRDNQEQLRQQLTSLFASDYRVASEAATLTEDSDFAASILVGKNSKLKKQ